jgi:hypothetical protein
MSYLNQPEKVYISSDDITSNNQNSGEFTVDLSDPIVDAKKVSILSCEYPSSFYNIESTDIFYFDEVYRDALSGLEKKRMNYAVSGLVSDNYTALELKTALNAKLTYSTGVSPLVATEYDITQIIDPSEQTDNGVLTAPFTSTTRNATDSNMFVKHIRTSTDAGYFHSISFDIDTTGATPDMAGDQTAYGFLIKKINNVLTTIFSMKLNKANSNVSGDKFVIPVASYKISSLGEFYLAVILPPSTAAVGSVGGQIKAKVNTRVLPSLVAKSIDAGQIDPLITLTNSFDATLINQIQNTPFTLSTLTNAPSAPEPVMSAISVPTYSYQYNGSATDHYLKAKIELTYDESKKRFTIKANKHIEFRDVLGNLVGGDTFPFYKNITSLGRTTKINGIDSFLEIPNKRSDKQSINYKIGARDNSTSYIASQNTLTNISLTMPHIPKLVLYPYLFLCCDFVNSSMKSGRNRTNILQKLPLTSEYGNLNYFNLSSTDSSVYSTINRDNIQSMKFLLSDNDNNIVNLNGGELSFTLAFQY